MFGSNNQNQGSPIVNPVQGVNDANLGSVSQPATTNQSSGYSNDPSATFPPTTNPDPFGTTQNNATVAEPSDATPSGADSDLIEIKQQALQHLSPLVQHIDQPAEEKFKTTMMMIQASDDKTLIPTAYEAAKLIEDDKARAQALLDLINEINYFTQQTS